MAKEFTVKIYDSNNNIISNLPVSLEQDWIEYLQEQDSKAFSTDSDAVLYRVSPEYCPWDCGACHG